MLVDRVNTFTEELSQVQAELHSTDKTFVETFRNAFKNRVSNTALDANDLEWIQQQFAFRWQGRKDGDKGCADDYERDYTFNTQGANGVLIAFAKELSVELNKPFLLILIPVLVNESDPYKISSLAEIEDPRVIFLGSDNKTWYRVLAFYRLLQEPYGILGIFEKTLSSNLRAFTLGEIYRLRSKRGEELALHLNGKTYSNFWDYVVHEKIEDWQKKGSCPTHTLPLLLKVIESYFSDNETKNNFEPFRMRLKRFQVALNACPIADVNYLYGIQIPINGSTHYLVEILVDCLQNSEDLSEKLRGVAHWLCEFDLSLTSRLEQLDSVYHSFKTGHRFDPVYLQTLIANLKVSGELQPRYNQLQAYIKSNFSTIGNENKSVRQEVVTRLRALYRVRWKEIAGKQLDYTRLQNKENRPFIRLAQYLAGTWDIDKNYYLFLMPTVNALDPITNEIISARPLDHYTLAEAGDALISLRNSKLNHLLNKNFYNCNVNPPIPFTETERERLHFAAPQFYRYFLRANEEPSTPPISKKTVNALRQLVNGILFYDGLLFEKISPADYDKAITTYANVMAYLDAFPLERIKLSKQSISLGAGVEKTSVQQLFEKLQELNYFTQECSSKAGKFFAQLVYYYAPHTLFVPEIENKVPGLEEMRLSGVKRVYSEYENLDEKVAIQRMQVMFISLMTAGFNQTESKIRFDKYRNTVSKSMEPIHGMLVAAFEPCEAIHIRFNYGQLMEHFIPRAKFQIKTGKATSLLEELKNALFSQEEPLNKEMAWLLRVQNGSLFTETNSFCFEPNALITVLWSMLEEKKPLRMLIKRYLDQVVSLLLEDENKVTNQIKMNIELVFFCNKKEVPETDRAEILRLLHATTTNPISQEMASQTVKAFLMHRIASESIVQRHAAREGIIEITPGCYKEKYAANFAKLEKKLTGCFEGNQSIPALFLNMKAALLGAEARNPKSYNEYLIAFSQQLLSPFTIQIPEQCEYASRYS
ncbi:MAG: hypothetical protein WC785_06710 [Tatlockia sp.]|jgi:hypothetical protein